MKIVIGDINVFYKLQELQIFAEFFALNLEFITTDFILNDIKQTQLNSKIELFTRSKNLIVKKLSVEDIQEIICLKRDNVIQGLTDLSAIWLSKKLNAKLLTDEKPIEGIIKDKSCNMEWIIKELLLQEIIEENEMSKLARHLEAVTYN